MDYSSEIRKNRVICVPFTEDDYDAAINDAAEFRAYIDSIAEQFPELFPPEISSGYLMKDIYVSENSCCRSAALKYRESLIPCALLS
jgi:hypothetical protein